MLPTSYARVNVKPTTKYSDTKRLICIYYFPRAVKTFQNFK